MKNIDITSGKIQIIDDDEEQVALLATMLRMEGYKNVACFTNPQLGTQNCLANPPDLLILDINMPKMSGFDVMARLRNANLDNPPIVLVVSAEDSVDARRRALDSFARDFLTRPFDVTELLARLRNLLEMKLLQNALLHQNNRLEEQVEQRTRELRVQTQDLINTEANLKQTQLKMIRHLGRAAEYRDNETGYHIVRMSKMAELLALKIGMTDKEANLILNASPMHDIGKIGIPDRILLKPGKLTDDEMRVMRSHAKIGADILTGDDSELLTLASEIALTHHERWDGKGYPAGLFGDNIPISGRICAVVDVFDALTSKRPYKEPWSVDKTVNYIDQRAGRHFDPMVVDAFISNLPAFEAIREQFQEPDGAVVLERMGDTTGIISLLPDSIVG